MIFFSAQYPSSRMKTLQGSKSNFFQPLNDTTNTFVLFIWEHSPPPGMGPYGVTPVWTIQIKFLTEELKPEKFTAMRRTNIKDRSVNRKMKLWKPWWGDFERLLHKDRFIRVSVSAGTHWKEMTPYIALAPLKGIFLCPWTLLSRIASILSTWWIVEQGNKCFDCTGALWTGSHNDISKKDGCGKSQKAYLEICCTRT